MRTRLGAPAVYLALIGGTSFFRRLIFTMYMLFQVDVAGLTALQLVLVGTALEAAIMLFEIPTGIVADTVSRRLSIVIGTALVGAAFVVQAVPIFAVIVAGSFLWGLGYTFTSGATAAWIYDEVGEEQASELFLRGAQVEQIMGIAALPVSVLLGLIAPAIAIIVGGVGYLLLAGFLLLAMPEDHFRPAPRAERTGWAHALETARGGFALVRVEPVLLLILGVTLFTGLYSEAYDRLWSKHLIDLGMRGLPLPVWFGLIALVGNGLGFAAAGVARRIEAGRREQIVRSLLWLNVGMVIALGLLALAPALWPALLAKWLFDMLRHTTFPLYDTWINQRITESSVRATVISISGQVDAAGQLAGGPPLGLLGGWLGVRAALLAASGLLVPAVGLLARARRREQRALAAQKVER